MKVGFLLSMSKKLCSLILCFCVLLCGSGCTAEEPITEITRTPIVAVVSDTTATLAATEYCAENKYELNELETLTDCAVSVENGKFDYLVCSEFEEELLKDFSLKEKEVCGYKSQYSLCFSAESTELFDAFNSGINTLVNDGTIEEICDIHKRDGDYKSDFVQGEPISVFFTDGISEFAIIDENGDAIGLEFDIITAICNSMGYSPEFINGEYDEGFALLEDGEVDFIMSVDYLNSIFDDALVLTDPYLEIEYIVYELNV